MTLKTYPVGPVWGGLIVYNSSYTSALMNAFALYGQDGQLDTNSAVITYMGINNNTLLLTLVYFGSIERPVVFQPFYNIPAIFDLTRQHDNFTDLIDQQADAVVPRYVITYHCIQALITAKMDLGHDVSIPRPCNLCRHR
jgi:hypothetical protein